MRPKGTWLQVLEVLSLGTDRCSHQSGFPTWLSLTLLPCYVFYSRTVNYSSCLLDRNQLKLYSTVPIRLLLQSLKLPRHCHLRKQPLSCIRLTKTEPSLSTVSHTKNQVKFYFFHLGQVGCQFLILLPPPSSLELEVPYQTHPFIFHNY